MVHIDGTLIRGNVSWESLVERHVKKVIHENCDEEDSEGGREGSKERQVQESELDRSRCEHGARVAQSPVRTFL